MEIRGTRTKYDFYPPRLTLTLCYSTHPKCSFFFFYTPYGFLVTDGLGPISSNITVIPWRSQTDLKRLNTWILLFSTPAAGQEYQSRARRLRALVANNIRTSSSERVAPSANYIIDRELGYTLGDYTLTTPWLWLTIRGQLAPFSSKVQSAIDLHNSVNLVRTETGFGGFPVRLWIDGLNLLPMTAKRVQQLLFWDAKMRGVPWQLADTPNAIMPLDRDSSSHEMLGSKDAAHENNHNPTATARKIENWRLLFQTYSEAKRFVRVWHRRPLPEFTSLAFSDPQPLIKAECLLQGTVF